MNQKQPPEQPMLGAAAAQQETEIDRASKAVYACNARIAELVERVNIVQTRLLGSKALSERDNSISSPHAGGTLGELWSAINGTERLLDELTDAFATIEGL